ncbi:MAG: hypothetical protein K2O35_04175 [Clostridia bacterium]|nr:hypothetical protein [Clostridia bacterium]
MKKKKLVIFLLVAIMVLTLAVTALVGCKPEKDPNENPTLEPAPEGYKHMSTGLASALKSTLYNSAEGELINNLKAGAQLRVKTNYGDSTKEYLIKLGLNLALNTEDENKNTLSVSIVDVKANNANILNVYYNETSSNYVFVDLGAGENAKHFALNGVKVKDVLKSENKNVSQDEANKINETVTNKVAGVCDLIDTISAFGKAYQAEDNSHVLFRLNLSDALTSAAQMLGIIDSYTEELGLDLKGSDLISVLPGVTIDLSFKMTGAGSDDFKTAKYAGIEAKLGATSKDLKIQRTDKTDFLHINIAKDCSADIALDFNFGGNVSFNRPLADGKDYTQISAINFTAAGELELKEAIGIKVNFNNKEIPLEIPTGKYTIELAADLDPTKLIGINFNAKKTSEILTLVEQITSKVINVLSIKIVNTADETQKIDVSIKNGNLYLTDLSLIGQLGDAVSGILGGEDGMSISDAINAIKGVPGLIPPDKEDPDTGSGDNETEDKDEDEDEDEDIDLAPIAELIKNLTLIADSGEINVNVKNHTVNKNLKYETDKDGNLVLDDKDEPIIVKDYGDTKINATAIANKDGVTITASLLNIVFNQEHELIADISAKIEANSNGITITAKSAATLDDEAEEIDFGSNIKMKIDLVLNLTEFKYGACPTK